MLVIVILFIDKYINPFDIKTINNDNNTYKNRKRYNNMKLGVFANRDFINAFNNLIEKDIPAAAAYRLSKIHKVLAEENERFEDGRRKAVLKYCELNEDGETPALDKEGKVKIKEDKLHELEEELTELSNIEFEVDTVSVKNLGNISISGKTLTLLSDIIVD